jgi:hypothetical protein
VGRFPRQEDSDSSRGTINRQSPEIWYCNLTYVAFQLGLNFQPALLPVIFVVYHCENTYLLCGGQSCSVPDPYAGSGFLNLPSTCKKIKGNLDFYDFVTFS